MRARPIRPNIYLPVVRFGVADSDWFSVLLISCAGYLLPIPFGITLLYVPLQMWTWLLVTAASIAFFNYIRIGKRPRWLPHKVKAVFWHHRQYRAIPNGKKRSFNRCWLIDPPPEDIEEHSPDSQSAPRTGSVLSLLEHHREFQEAYEERWNAVMLTTN
jgi:hypothetical protein